MASLKGRLLDLMGGMALQTATVRAIDAPDSAFRIVTLAVTDRGKYTPGAKLQILMPDRSVRTYTPVGWGESSRLVVHRHDSQTPAGRWIDGLEVGQTVRFLGPQRALSMPAGAITLLGDATSIATAAAYQLAAPGTVEARFWMTDTPQATLVALGLAHAQVHATVDAVIDGVSGAVGITGSGAFVKQARAALKARADTKTRVKAYWIQGRTGLD